jgi:hypothetical protein
LKWKATKIKWDNFQDSTQKEKNSRQKESAFRKNSKRKLVSMMHIIVFKKSHNKASNTN